MLRTIVAYITLVAFINTYCVQDVLATMTHPELRVEEPRATDFYRYEVHANQAGQYVLNGEDFKYLDLFDLELESNGVLVGQLVHKQGQVYLKGHDTHSFYIANMPNVQSLRMHTGGSVTFETLVTCQQLLDLNVAGKTTFLNGFRIGERTGLANFGGGDVDLASKSFTPLMKLARQQSLLLQKNSMLDCAVMVTDGMVKSIKALGELYIGIAALEAESLAFNHKAQISQAKLKTGKVTNTGQLDIGLMDMDKASFFNTGHFHSKTVTGTGSWANGAKGTVLVEELFRGNFYDYTDDGSTTVWGFVTVQAETGRLTGDLKARNAMIRFQDDVMVPKKAKFTIENYFALHSDKNMDFLGSLLLKHQHKWPKIEPSAQLRAMLRNIDPGAYLSAKGNLNRGGHVASNNSSVRFSAGGKYEDVGGSYRSGFFNGNNTHINAAHAKLGAESQSFSDTIVAAKLVELMGARDIAGALRIFATDLTQHENDKTKAGSVFTQAENATLAGQFELSEHMMLKLLGFFKTLSSNLIQGGTLGVEADSAALAGRLMDLTLQVIAKKDITLEKTFDADLKTSSMDANNILHKAGSSLTTAGLNLEKAKHDITLEHGANVAAQDNIFKAGHAVYNSGRVDAEKVYHADTGFHYNWFGGRITADRAIIDADWWNVTFLSDLSANSAEINTLFNSNALARVHGRDSLAVSALVNAQFGLNQSNAYTSNSLLSINPLSLLTFNPIAFIPMSLPSFGGSKEQSNSSAWGTTALRQGISLASMIEGPYRSVLMGAQLLWSAKDLAYSAYGMATADTRGDEGNYWRSSRMMKRTGPALALGLSAYQTAKGAMNLYDRVYPELPKAPEATQPAVAEPTSSEAPAPATNSTATPELTKPQQTMWNATQALGLDTKLGVKVTDMPGLMNATRDMGLNALGITAVDNSLFCWNNGWNLTGHITRRNIWDYDNSWTMALSTYVSTGQGADYGTKYTLKSTATASKWSLFGRPVASGNYEVGGHKNVFLDYTVDAAGDVLVKKDTNIKAKNNSVKADGKMKVEFGAVANATTSEFTSKGDMEFGGKAYGSEKSVVVSTKGDATLRTGGSVTSDKSASVTAAGLASTEKDSLINGGEKSTLVGQGGTEHSGRAAGQKIQMGDKTSKTHFKSEGEIEILASEEETKNNNAESKEQNSETPAELDYDLKLHGKEVINEGKIKGKPGALVQISSEDGLQTTSTADVNLPGGTLHTNGKTNYVEAGAKFSNLASYKQNGQERADFAGALENVGEARLHSDGDATVKQGADFKAKDVALVTAVGLASSEQDSNIEARAAGIYGQGGTTEAGQVAGEKIVMGDKTSNTHIQSTGLIKILPSSEPAAPKAEPAPEVQPAPEVPPVEPTENNSPPERQYDLDIFGKKVLNEGRIEGQAGSSARISAEEAAQLTSSAVVNMPGGHLAIQGRTTEIDPASHANLGSLSLKGNGIQGIPELYTQTGRWQNWRITDHIAVTTDQHVHFTQSATSASKGFELHTSQITVDPRLNFTSPEFLILDSTLENLTIGHGTTIGGGVHTGLSSAKDVVYGFEKTLVYGKGKHKKKVVDVKYSTVTVLGGSGVEYEYIDPATGEKSIRKVGIGVRAGGHVLGTGVNYVANKGDIIVSGAKGVTNGGDAQRYISKIKTKEKFFGKKEKVYHDTAFCAPVMSTDGKIQVFSDEGGYTGVANFMYGGQGTDIIVKGDVNMPLLRGKTGKTTTRSYGNFDSKERSRHEVATTATLVNPGQHAARIWTSSGNVNAPGFVYYGRESKLSMKGHDAYLSRPILNHHTTSSGISYTGDYSMFTHLKSLNGLQAAKDTFHDLNNGAYGDAFMHMAAPSAEVGVNFVNTESCWQTLGAGSILAGQLEMNFTGGIYQTNAYGIKVLGDAWVTTPIWEQEGAKLKYRFDTNYFGFFARGSGQEATVGFRFGGSTTKGYTWEAAETSVGGTLHADIGHLSQDAAHMDVGSASGHIDEITSRTRQDKSKTTGWGVSVAYNVLSNTVTGSANYWENGSRQSNHTSGLTVHNASDDFTIDRAKLKGADLNGVVARAMSYKSLPEEYTNRGFSVGLTADITDALSSGDFSKARNVVAHGGVSDGDFSINASVKLGQQPRDPSKLWNDIGTVTVNGVPIPLMYSLNPDAWAEFGTDLKEVGGKIADGAGHVMETLFPAPEIPADLPLTHQKTDDSTIGLEQRLKAIPPLYWLYADQYVDTPGGYSKISLSQMGLPTAELLMEPLEFDGVTYNCKMTNSNVFLEHPRLMWAANDSLNTLKDALPNRAQKSYAALRDPELAVFFSDGIPEHPGVSGYLRLENDFTGKHADGLFSHQTLNGFCIRVDATLENELFPTYATLGHEGMHYYWALLSGGNPVPGSVADDRRLSVMNLSKLSQSFAADLRKNGERDLSFVPWTVYDYFVLSSVCGYFQDTFKNEARDLCMPEAKVSKYLTDAERDFVNDKPPSSQLLDPSWMVRLSSKKQNVLQRALVAEETLAAELPAWFTNADLNLPGIAKSMAPNTSACLEEMEKNSPNYPMLKELLDKDQPLRLIWKYK